MRNIICNIKIFIIYNIIKPYLTPGKRVCCVISSANSSPASPKCFIVAEASAYFLRKYSSISSSFWVLKRCKKNSKTQN